MQLELNGNKLDGNDLNIIIKQCPNLRKLKLENNNIIDITNLKKLLGLNIKKINLSGNPFIKDNPDYKNKLFNIFLSLISIDGTDKEGNDIESTEYEKSQNIFEQIESKSNDENVDKDKKDENNESKSLSEDFDYLEEEYEFNSINDEEEEEEDDSKENIDNNDKKINNSEK